MKFEITSIIFYSHNESHVFLEKCIKTQWITESQIYSWLSYRHAMFQHQLLHHYPSVSPVFSPPPACLYGRCYFLFLKSSFSFKRHGLEFNRLLVAEDQSKTSSQRPNLDIYYPD